MILALITILSLILAYKFFQEYRVSEYAARKRQEFMLGDMTPSEHQANAMTELSMVWIFLACALISITLLANRIFNWGIL